MQLVKIHRDRYHLQWSPIVLSITETSKKVFSFPFHWYTCWALSQQLFLRPKTTNINSLLNTEIQYSLLLNRRLVVLEDMVYFSQKPWFNTRTAELKTQRPGGFVDMAFPHLWNNDIIIMRSKQEKLNQGEILDRPPFLLASSIKHPRVRLYHTKQGKMKVYSPWKNATFAWTM